LFAENLALLIPQTHISSGLHSALRTPREQTLKFPAISSMFAPWLIEKILRILADRLQNRANAPNRVPLSSSAPVAI
jgi:hypothetical protein